MAEILNIFSVIGFCVTLAFIHKVLHEVLHERKMEKLAEEWRRKLFEERRRERLEAEWRNMTTAGTKGAVFFREEGRWTVLTKVTENTTRRMAVEPAC